MVFINDERFDSASHIESLPLGDSDDTFDWHFVDPCKLLPHLLEASEALSALYARALAEHPVSLERPWHMIVTWDEFCPGNKLKIDNRRKCMNLCINFLELGPAALSQDWTWMTPICVRTCKIREVKGGWPAMLRRFFRHILLGPAGFCTAGVPISIPGREPLLLFGKVSALLSDGDGLRQAMDWKGSSSLKPCLKHFNVFKKASDLAHRSPGHVEMTCCDYSAFRLQSSSDLFAIADLLLAAQQKVAEGTMTKIRWNQLEIINGLNTNEDGLLTDPMLRTYLDPIGALRYDWLHNMLQDGVMTTETFQFLRACEPHGVRPQDLQAFLRDEGWQFPLASRAKSKDLHRVFDEFRSGSSEEHERLKCSASELLGLYGMLRHYVATRVPHHPDLAAKRASWEALCQCIDLILHCKRGFLQPRDATRQLKAATAHHFRLHLEAYGEDLIKPKNHWQIDMVEQIEVDGCVLDAFLIERTHVKVKAIADHIRNTSSFERSVLSGVLNCHFRTLAQATDIAGLRGNTAPLPGYPEVRVADRLEIFALQAFLKGLEPCGYLTPRRSRKECCKL